MRPATLLRLAFAGGRADALRIALTAVSAALATLVALSAATVLAIRKPKVDPDFNFWSEQYTNGLLREPELRQGLAFGMLLLVIPVLGLAAQCSRLGAPARERRLAAFRLAGATPGQAVRVAAGETGLAAALGSAFALAAYLVGREVLHRPLPEGKLALPTDVRLAPWIMAAICLAVPALAGLLSAVALRRVIIGPLSVVRRTRTRPPRPWPGVVLGIGIALFAGALPLEKRFGGLAFGAALFGGALLVCAGVVLGTGWIAATVGRLLRRSARRPSVLLAGRRLEADPWSGSRSFATLILATVVGAGAAGMWSWFDTELKLRNVSQRRLDALLGFSPPGAYEEDPFYASAFRLVGYGVAAAAVIAAVGVLIAIAEGVVARRRAYTMLVASGVPRGVLARSVLWQSLAPLVPALLVAVAVGAALPQTLVSEVHSGGSTATTCTSPVDQPGACEDPQLAPQYERTIELESISAPVPVPWDLLALVGGGALLAGLLAVLVGLLFLRPSTDPAELRTA